MKKKILVTVSTPTDAGKQSKARGQPEKKRKPMHYALCVTLSHRVRERVRHKFLDEKDRVRSIEERKHGNPRLTWQ